MIPLGRTIDRYVVESLLGQGGMADVYVVRHSVLATRHALKVLHTDAATLGPRLLTEGKVQATLRHPNLVRVTDTIEVDGAPGLVMDLVEGESLDEHLERRSFDLATKLDIFRAMLDAVAEAHRHGVVHRDLKPANVLITFDRGIPVPRITDFGLVKVLQDGAGLADHMRTRSGIPIGTPAYMAPEQVEGLWDVDHRADIFALGSLLYELVSGVRPFQRPTVGETYAAVSRAQYEPLERIAPDAPPAVVTAVHACLRKDRRERPQGVAELAAILDGAPAPRPDVPRRPGLELALIVATVVALVASAAIALTVASAWRTPPGPVGPAVTTYGASAGGAPAVSPATPAASPATPAASPATPAASPATPAASPATSVASPATPAAPRPSGDRPAAGRRVGFVGATAVRLVDGDHRFDLPAAVPPGTYDVLADFGGGLAPAGRAAVSAGQTLRCDAAFETCRADGT